jgi:hypothetical protein
MFIIYQYIKHVTYSLVCYGSDMKMTLIILIKLIVYVFLAVQTDFNV